MPCEIIPFKRATRWLAGGSHTQHGYIRKRDNQQGMRFHPTTKNRTELKNYDLFTSITFQLGFSALVAMEPQEEKLKKWDTESLFQYGGQFFLCSFPLSPLFLPGDIQFTSLWIIYMMLMFLFNNILSKTSEADATTQTVLFFFLAFCSVLFIYPFAFCFVFWAWSIDSWNKVN